MNRGKFGNIVPDAVPKRRRYEKVRPVKTIDYKKDINPFSSGLGISIGIFAFGATIIYLLLFHGIPIYLAPVGVGLSAYGIGRAYVLFISMQQHFQGGEETETEEEILEDVPAQQNVYWVNLGTTTVKMPPEPYRGSLQEFAKAIISGKATFSELGGADLIGAKDFGYSTNLYNDLRNIFLKNKLAFWKNEQYPQQGIQLTERGTKVIRAIAEGNTSAAQEYFN